MGTFLNQFNLAGKLLLIMAAVFFLLFTIIALFSFREREKRAAIRSLVLSIIFPIVPLVFALPALPMQPLLSNVILAVFISGILLLIIPIPASKKIKSEQPVGRIDERLTMFSRNELKEGTKLYSEFYSNNPDKLQVDLEFRKLPGLLSRDSLYADPVIFAASDSYFEVCEALRSPAVGKPSGNRVNTDPEGMSEFIKRNALNMGAHSIGVTRLRDHHLYSTGGRRERYNRKYDSDGHSHAIAFTVEMNHELIGMGPAAPSIMESARCYQHGADIAVQTAVMIRKLGYSAQAHIDGFYKVVCPLVARDAGLGEIGRMGILITPKLGPRVRIAVVTTDMPLKIDERNFDPSVTEFCNACKKCATLCPSKAISDEPRKKTGGGLRWQIDQEKCFTFWCKAGTDCARCVAVCPYSHPDNLFHNTVRFFLRRSFFFRKIAALMDDLVYGKKPKPRKVSDWLRVGS